MYMLIYLCIRVYVCIRAYQNNNEFPEQQRGVTPQQQQQQTKCIRLTYRLHAVRILAKPRIRRASSNKNKNENENAQSSSSERGFK